LASVAVAYNYSLISLLQTVDFQTSLACISLVPAIALALAAVRARPLKPEPPIHDRQVDYTIGIPLIVTALVFNELLPSRMSAMFWAYRVDLLTLPIFVAGTVAILFGSRVLWRQKLAILFLFLAWPYPFEKPLLGMVDGFTNLTLLAVEKFALFTHLATPVGLPDRQLLVVNHGGSTFALNVVSACSGVSGLVGFLLVGLAFGVIVRGPIVRKVLWLAGGLFVLWAINLGRITLAFLAGKAWGEGIALDFFRPLIALVTLSLGALVMILLIKPLGMRTGIGRDRQAMSVTPPKGPIPVPSLYRSSPSPSKGGVALAVPSIYLALVVTLVAALVLGISNYGLRTYNLVAGVPGEPTLIAFTRSPAAPPGWQVRYATSYNWAKPLFGYASVWNRYSLRDIGPGPLRANVPVVADVINTPDLSTFAYAVENCYTFNGYSLVDVATVTLSGGITGQAMSFASQQFGSWSMIDWIVPVKSGLGTNYERVVLYVQDSTEDAVNIEGATQGAVLPRLTAGNAVHNVAGSLSPTDPADQVLIDNRTFLVAFGKEIIDSQARHLAPPVSATAVVKS
jgi:exosortase/archaeosortase family protein